MSKYDLSNAVIFGVGAVVENEGKFLLVREGENNATIGKKAGMYTFPSGFVKQDELGTETIEREVLEETGYKVKVIDIIGLYRVKGAMGIAFRTKLMDSKHSSTTDADIAKIEWLTPEEIRHKQLRPANLDILRDYLAGRSFPLSLVADSREK